MAIKGICTSPQHIAPIPSIALSSIPTFPSVKTTQHPPPHLNSPTPSSNSATLAAANLVSNDAIVLAAAAAEAAALAIAAAQAARDAVSAAAGVEEDWPLNTLENRIVRYEGIQSEEGRKRRRRIRRRKVLGYVEVEEKSDGVKHGRLFGSMKSRKLSPEEEAKICMSLKEESRLIETQRTLLKSQVAGPMSRQLAHALKMEERTIDKVRCKGRESRELLTRNYKRLVVSIATAFQGKGLSLEDLIQEGSMGLLRGAEKYDPQRGHKLSSYVYWWIKQAVMSAVDKNSRLVRLTGNMCQMIPKVAEARTTLSRRLHRSPTNSEIAETLNVDDSIIRFVSMKCISLDKAVAEHGHLTIQEILPGPEEMVPEKIVKRHLLRNEIERLLNMLDQREAEVLRLRYGLINGNAPLTYEEIGRLLKMSRETVRQTNIMALEKLQQNANVESLKYYVG